MKTTSYKTYKCNGFTLKYYTKSCIQDGIYYGEYVVAYYNGRRIVDRSTSEKRGLYDIICRLSDEERRLTTDAYIKENAARMGVAPCIVKAHIEEVQKKNGRAAVPAQKMEITAADIALYDYALGGAPVDGYTIGCADAVLKLMKKAGITPAAVDRARKKMKKQQPAPAPAPAVDAEPAPVADAGSLVVVWSDDMDNAIANRTADTCPLPAWAVDGVRCTYNSREYGLLTGTACRFHWVQVCHCWLCDFSNGKTSIIGAVVDNIKPLAAADSALVVDTPATDTPAPASQKTAKQIKEERVEKVIADYECGIYPNWYGENLHCESSYFFNCDVISWGRKQIKVKNLETGKNKIFPYDWFIRVVEHGSYIVSMPYDAEYMAKYHATLNKKQPAVALTDADMLAQAARIKSNYEAIKQQAAADAYADAITAYCAALEEPVAPAEEQPAAAHYTSRRLSTSPRTVLHRLGRVAAVVLPLLFVAMFICVNNADTASAHAADAAAVTTCQAEDETAAHVVELPAVTVTADNLTMAPAAPSPVKKLAAPSPVKKAAADAVTPSNQKTSASDNMNGADIAAAADDGAQNYDRLQPIPPDGLTICAGTAWAYTIMNWA